MRVVDCHVHMRENVDASETLKAMDANGVDRMLVISKKERVSLPATRSNVLATKALIDAAPDRFSGLAWLDPRIPGIKGLAKEVLQDMGFSGIKIIPDHYYVHEDRFEPFWECLHELEASILFHTGILYGNDDSSRFCRPVYLEKLLHYPKIRFAMAHISWPWCEECLATMGRMRAAVGYQREGWQSYVDLTPGTPRHIRKQAVANAIDFCGADHIMFGTDASVPGDLSHQKQVLEGDLAIFDELGLDDEQKSRILAGTADEVFPART